MTHKPTPLPWKRCFHLRSEENDRKCPCGYRGGIWGGAGDDETLVCEMRNCGAQEGHEMMPIGSRETQLANAAFIVRSVNRTPAFEAMKAGLETLETVFSDFLALHIETDADEGRKAEAMARFQAGGGEIAVATEALGAIAAALKLAEDSSNG